MKLVILLAIGLFTSTPATQHAPSASIAATPSHPSAAGPGRPQIGESAPDFTFQSYDHAWRNLHDLLEQGHVLLVFGPSEEDLRALERDSGALLGAGVVPVAIVHARDADAWKLVQRYRLTYSLLSDPRADLASSFGVADGGATGSHATWFLVDRSGRVRGAGDTRPAIPDWARLANSALGHGEIEAASTR